MAEATSQEETFLTMATQRLRRSRPLISTLLAMVLIAGVAMHQPPVASADVDTTGAYLDRLNELRGWAGLPAVTEDADLVTDAEAAARWLVDNGEFTHNINDPSASEAAVRGAAESNLYATSRPGGDPPEVVIDGWANSFGHGMWALHPQLSRTGYGYATDEDAPLWPFIAALNVIGGLDVGIDLDAADFPLTFPADGVTGFDLPGDDQRSPDQCPEAVGPTLRVIGGAERGDAFDGSSFRSVTVAINGHLVPVCVAGGDDFASLATTDSTAIVPHQPLPPGSRVDVTGQFRGGPLGWSFATPGPIDPQRLCLPAPSPFVDVAEGAAHEAAITCLAALEVINGTAPGRFSPADELSRGQMASLIARLLDHIGAPLPGGATDAFSDDAGSVHEAALNRLAAARIFLGRADGRADPQTFVSRAELAAYLDRSFTFAELEAEAGPPVSFPDDAGVHEASIQRMATLGLIGGRADGSFGPAASTTRSQTATLLARLGVLGTPGA